MKRWISGALALLLLFTWSTGFAVAEALPTDAAETVETAEAVEPDGEETEASVTEEDTAEEQTEADAPAVEAPAEESDAPEEPDAPEEAVEAPAEDPQSADETLTTQSVQPVLALTLVPAYGKSLPVQGVVCDENGGTIAPKQYRVTLYVELTEYSTFWVKPSEAMPSVPLNSDGSFSVEYDGALKSDRTARRLHILLIPASYSPTVNGFQDALAHALDYVKVERDEAGGVTVTPNRTAPARSVSTGKPSGLRVNAKRAAMNVGFYTTGRPGDALSEAEIRTLLQSIRPFTDTVRFYSSGGAVSSAYKIAHDMGFRVVGTAWLSGSASADRAELDALLAQCSKGYAQVACVGSETLLRRDLTAEKLIEYLEYVRKRLKNADIPVTTADTCAELIKAPNVRGACDILLPNLYPYWEGVSVQEAASAFASEMADLELCADGKEIVVSETGWPSRGESVGKAVAGQTQAAAYFEAVRAWSLEHNTVVLWFDAADEPWKKTNEGEAGAHWGVLTKDLVLKDGYAKTAFFRSIAAEKSVAKASIGKIENVRGGVKLSWRKAKNAVRYDVYCKNGKSWKLVGRTKNTALTVKKSDSRKALRSGVRYTFAVQAVGSQTKAARSAAKSLVYLAAPTWGSVKNDKRGSVNVRWKRGAASAGTQVQYGADKGFQKPKTVTVTKAAALRVSGLKKGKRCYVRLRSWRKVSGKRVCSGWSAVKSVKVAK